uniref:Uncharacterized protein LOC116942611 isoform X3 n=1 Tax=Petromyzon marinus TaxID=7757 RepID=A0AAJ7WVW5_PETMA|nr:uncharacterized protein LOC116942611 isoform X3 [Petromyzon marinus]
MKHLRPFKIVGPLIIILGKMAVYILKAFFLFGQFFLAFFFSFWLIFGNKDVASFKTVPATLFTMFRISVVDMDEYEAMHKRDFTMLYILVASFLSITNIFVHNAILIAMLNQAYKRVSLNPVGNEYMQRVILLLSLEKNPLFRSRREGTRDYIQRCARFECSYGAGDEGPGSDGCGGGRDAAQLEYGRVSLKIEGAPRVAGRAAGNRVGAVDAVPPAGGGSGTVLGAACGGSGHPGGGAGAAGPPAGARGQEAEPRTAPSPAGKGNGSAIVNVT